MDTVFQDVRYALRTLRKNPVFAAVAILTLSLGIGATAAIFSVVDNVLLKPLPYDDSERLVRLMHEAPSGSNAVARGAFSPPDFDDLKAASNSYENLAGYYYIPGQSDIVMTGQGEPEEVESAFVSGEFFQALGMSPVLGRAISETENFAGKDRVVVISNEFWKRRFDGRSDALGKTLQLDGEPFTVIGIMPPHFDYPAPEAEFWLPLSLIGEDDIPRERDLRWLSVIGKLKPGVALEAAATETDAILQRLENEYAGTNEGWNNADVQSLHAALVGDVRPALLVLMVAVGMVLLIACANLANILLARGTARSREIAVRTALGAKRVRVMRQVLTESIVLATLGGALGLLLATFGVEVLLQMSAGIIPRPDEVALDLRVVAFTLLASVLTGVAFGLLPSLTASQVNVRQVLDEGGRGGTSSRRRNTIRSILVGAQLALAVVLLVGAGLLAKSLWHLVNVDPGFDTADVLTLTVSTPSEVMERDDRQLYREELIERVRNLPGVTAVGAAKIAPFQGKGEPYSVNLPGRAEPVMPEAGTIPVTPGYFEALGIPILQGRGIEPRDDDRYVLVVNQAFVERYLGQQDVVGMTVSFVGADFEIVGVVGDVRQESVAIEPAPTIYAQSSVFSRTRMQLFVRTSVDPVTLINPVRRLIWDMNPNQPITDIGTMQAARAETVARPRFLAVLLGAFSVIAALLAAIGVYGVVAYIIARRTHELGIRMALGAKPADLTRLLLGQGMLPTLAGVAVGIVAAFMLSRVLTSQLYGVGAADPATFIAVGMFVIVTAALAAWVPTRRAARTEPVIALNAE